jgi:hypothetical protein
MTISIVAKVNLGTAGREVPPAIAAEEGPFPTVAAAGSAIPAERTDFGAIMMAVGSIPVVNGADSGTMGVGENSMRFGGKSSVLRGFSEVWVSKGVEVCSCSPPSNTGSWMFIALMLGFMQWDGLSHPIACTIEEAEMPGPKPF